MANNQYLTFIALEDCEFSVRVWSGYPHMSRYYSVDNGNSWVSLSSSSEKAPLVTTPTITSGNTILWRGETNSSYAGEFGIFSSTGRFIAEGNALSIDNFLNFSGCTNLVSAENITFTNGVYKGYTFEGCTSLVTPPPSVPDGGVGVFSGCTSMTSLPTIQNTTLDFECFKYMFKGCSSLTTIPSNYLPSQIMAMRCYVGMFEDCTSLVNVPSDLLQAPVLTDGCYEEMFKGCTSLRIAPNLNYGETLIYPNTDGAIYKSMFENCTSLEKIPILNEKFGGFSNYQYTFKGCTSLTHVTVNAYGGQSMFENCTSLSAVTCLGESPYWQDIYQWLKGVQSYGIFYRSPSTNWRRDDSGIPEGWEVADFGSGIYKKYHVAKEQYRLETGGTWTDTDPLVTEISGDPIARYATLSECEAVTATTRWIESGTTCINGDKYQNNYKQISDDGDNWRDSNPLEWSASTVIEYDSEDCKIYKWSVVSGGYECSGTTKMTQEKLQESIDGGSTWTDVIPLQTRAALPVIEEFSSACGFMPPSSGDYLTFIALEDTEFYAFDTYCNNEVSYSMDGGATWIRSNRTGNIKKGDVVLWKGECRPCMKSGDHVGIGNFPSTGNKFNVGGNIMSLVYGDNFRGQTSLSGLGDYLFQGLFSYSQIVSAEHLYLPATTLGVGCYEYMFYRCSSLVTPPQELPAITLVDWCYYAMFDDCASLTKTPQMQPIHLAYACCGDMFLRCASLTTVPNELPATTLANDCYVEMFRGCTSLTTAPILPAGTLPENCYTYMFSGCTSLNSITCLATNIEDDWCTRKWVEGVAANGVFTRNSSMTSWTTGVNGIPRGWTVHVYNP